MELHFLTWLDEVEEKVLLFLDPEGNIIEKEYRTRFTSPEVAKSILKKFEEAWEIASQYDVGVFLTITLPPIFPLKIAQYLLSYILHRLRAYLRRKYGFTPPTIVSNEPQDNLNIHKHIVIFGIVRIMDKYELTIWLDDKVERFLSKMGHHIQKTVNNRLKEDEVKSLNKYGRKLLKKYRKYKRKHPKYRGPVNWLTKITNEKGSWEFENLPPDLEGMEKSVEDYIKKYIIKNAREAEEGHYDIKIAWYWLLRIPFYTLSPKLRKKRERPSPAGYIFLGSFKISDLEHLPLPEENTSCMTDPADPLCKDLRLLLSGFVKVKHRWG